MSQLVMRPSSIHVRTNHSEASGNTYLKQPPSYQLILQTLVATDVILPMQRATTPSKQPKTSK